MSTWAVTRNGLGSCSKRREPGIGPRYPDRDPYGTAAPGCALFQSNFKVKTPEHSRGRLHPVTRSSRRGPRAVPHVARSCMHSAKARTFTWDPRKKLMKLRSRAHRVPSSLKKDFHSKTKPDSSEPHICRSNRTERSSLLLRRFQRYQQETGRERFGTVARLRHAGISFYLRLCPFWDT